MSPIASIITMLQSSPTKACLAWKDRTLSRQELLDDYQAARIWIVQNKIQAGDPVILIGDYSPQCIALFLALIERKVILAPLARTTVASAKHLISIVAPIWIVTVSLDDHIKLEKLNGGAEKPFYSTLQKRKTPGLILFTSGSTGTPKAVIHDAKRLLEKFKTPRPSMVILNFLMFDHWGGLNTLLHGLSSGSLVVLPEKRNPEEVCHLIEQHRIELLPSTPTFLNMLLMSRTYENYDLSTLKLITYGAEPMPASTLNRLIDAFPGIELRQTYGLIELGVLRAKSKATDSLWVRIGGEGYDLRVIDGILQIKANSAMLGYLNAPSPFTKDGYFVTGDRVEVDGDFMLILGRETDLINVGGQKVYPAEVEAVLLEHEAVEDAVVYGEPNPIMGYMVCATVKHQPNLNLKAAQREIKRFCNGRLESYKIPVKLRFVQKPLFKDRFKRLRNNSLTRTS